MAKVSKHQNLIPSTKPARYAIRKTNGISFYSNRSLTFPHAFVSITRESRLFSGVHDQRAGVVFRFGALVGVVGRRLWALDAVCGVFDPFDCADSGFEADLRSLSSDFALASFFFVCDNLASSFFFFILNLPILVADGLHHLQRMHVTKDVKFLTFF